MPYSGGRVQVRRALRNKFTAWKISRHEPFRNCEEYYISLPVRRLRQGLAFSLVNIGLMHHLLRKVGVRPPLSIHNDRIKNGPFSLS
jgi:hypothetical protein